MPVIISMLRGINLGRHRRIAMKDLRSLYESLALRDVCTYVQSGNVVCVADERDLTRLTGRLEQGIKRTFGFHSDVIARTTADLRVVVAENPFRNRRGLEPSKLLVTFLATDPGKEGRDKLRRIQTDPEELRLEGRELYTYYPNGVGRSKLPAAAIESALATPGTARNWNTVTKLLEMAEGLETSV